MYIHAYIKYTWISATSAWNWNGLSGLQFDKAHQMVPLRNHFCEAVSIANLSVLILTYTWAHMQSLTGSNGQKSHESCDCMYLHVFRPCADAKDLSLVFSDVCLSFHYLVLQFSYLCTDQFKTVQDLYKTSSYLLQLSTVFYPDPSKVSAHFQKQTEKLTYICMPVQEISSHVGLVTSFLLILSF